MSHRRFLVSGAGNGFSFDSRSELVAWPEYLDGAIYSDGTVLYKGSSGATAISDLPGLVPFGDATPDHFASNTTPGTTDMTTALQAAVNYVATAGGVVRLLRRAYAISSAIEITTNNISIVGAGRNDTVIRQLTANTHGILISSENGDTYRRYCRIADLTIENNNADDTSGAIIRAERPRDLIIERCALFGGYDGIQILGGNTVWISDTMINYRNLTGTCTGAGIRFDRLLTTAEDSNGVQDAVDSLYYALGYVYFVNNCEIWGDGDYGKDHGIYVGQCDGLQISNTHIGRAAQGQITLKPSQANLVLQNINVSNCQLDPAAESLTGPSNYGVHLPADGLASRLFRDIQFSNCSILGADKDGIRIEEAVENFSWVGGSIKLCDDWGIRINDSGAAGVRIIGTTIRDSDQAGTSAGHILFNAGSGEITGVRGYGDGPSGIVVASGATVALADNIFPDATTPFNINASAIVEESASAKHRFTHDVTLELSSSVTPANNGDLMIQATSNTSLTFAYKGSDGVVRTGSITLS